MGITFHITISKFDESERERFGDAMTSSNPPLSEDSRAKINGIESSRLSSLVGADKYQAGLFFQILNKLPPIEGPRTTRLLTLIAETDFTFESLQSTFNELKPVPDISELPEPNDYGFVTLPGKLSYHDSDVEVTFDKKKSDREGVKTIAELYVALSTITNQETRALLVFRPESYFTMRERSSILKREVLS